MRKTETTDTRTKSEKRHGNRSVPPPVRFSLGDLPDDAPLSDTETAAILRRSRATLALWRQQPDHSLRWFCLPGGAIRYWAGSVKRYLTAGKPRKRKPKPAPAAPTAADDGLDIPACLRRSAS